MLCIYYFLIKRKKLLGQPNMYTYIAFVINSISKLYKLYIHKFKAIKLKNPINRTILLYKP